MLKKTDVVPLLPVRRRTHTTTCGSDNTVTNTSDDTPHNCVLDPHKQQITDPHNPLWGVVLEIPHPRIGHWFVCDLQISCHFTTRNGGNPLKTNDETTTFYDLLFVLSEQLNPSLINTLNKFRTTRIGKPRREEREKEITTHISVEPGDPLEW
jgi:hypothetical protein